MKSILSSVKRIERALIVKDSNDPGRLPFSFAAGVSRSPAVFLLTTDLTGPAGV